MKIEILYEDKDVLVIDKPSGILVHPNQRSKEETPNQSKLSTEQAISDWFLKKYPKAKNVGEPIFIDGKEIKKPGIVHRLDKETSGVLVLAKNQKAYEFLKEQFSAPSLELKRKDRLADKKNRIKKVYIAVVSGWVKNDYGIINKPIGRSPSDFRRRIAGRGARGELREAITEYKVLKRVLLPLAKGEVWRGSEIKSTSPQPSPYQGEGEKFTLLEIHPKTGRTHQIRVHMKFLNYPIICDSLYNPKGFCPKDLGRLALHAKAIEFTNLAGKKIKVESPLPKEFKKFTPH